MHRCGSEHIEHVQNCSTVPNRATVLNSTKRIEHVQNCSTVPNRATVLNSTKRIEHVQNCSTVPNRARVLNSTKRIEHVQNCFRSTLNELSTSALKKLLLLTIGVTKAYDVNKQKSTTQQNSTQNWWDKIHARFAWPVDICIFKLYQLISVHYSLSPHLYLPASYSLHQPTIVRYTSWQLFITPANTCSL